LDKLDPAGTLFAMGSARKNRIRPISRETRFVRLRSLNCFPEVHQRIAEGTQAYVVAEYIQNEMGEYKDVGLPSLTSVLTDYRLSLPPTVLAAKVPRVVAAAAERVRVGLDELAEMEKLYAMQLERIEIDFKTEKGINKLMPSMTQEMRAGREILADIAKLKMDLGLNERHLGKMEVDAQIMTDVTKRYDESVGKTLTSPESRRKLLGIAERFLSLAAGKAGVDITVSERVEENSPDEAEVELGSAEDAP